MIDPGKSFAGLAIVRDDEQRNRTILFCATLQHRNDVRKRLTQRASFRRTRRGRLRFRKPRFSNRRRSTGWLPPSLRSRLDNTLTWIDRLTRLIAISEDPCGDDPVRHTASPEPRSPRRRVPAGPALPEPRWRAFVIHRDNSTCRYCGKKAKPVELDHVIPRSLSGPNTPWNLVVACHKCNQRKGNKSLAEFLKRRPQRLADIKAQLQKPLASAAHMNVIIPELLRRLCQQGHHVTEHDAAQTAANRQTLNVKKDHHIDAAVLGEPTTLRGVPNHILSIKAIGRGQRKRVMPDKSGTPCSQDWPNYCRLSPAERRKIPNTRPQESKKNASTELAPETWSKSSTPAARYVATLRPTATGSASAPSRPERHTSAPQP